MAAPDWLADAIFYQIFPDRYANADHQLDPPDVVAWDSPPTRDNFLGGDLRGIEDHLDHVASLGANAIYLTPIFEACTNHRYDCTDYFTIDHRLGTIDDFRRLLATCHSRGIRLVLDGVFNHCGDHHTYFQDVVKHETESEYVNWFYVEGFPVTATPALNYRTCSGCAYLPKWNAHNPAVRDHHYRVARHWIGEGIDGWRLDVPYMMNLSFWRGFRDVVKGIDENLCIIAEDWRQPDQWLAGDTADGTMNYTLRDLILGFVADRTLDGPEFAAGMNRLHARIPDGYHHGMLNLLGSHDTERVLTRCAGDIASIKDAYSLLFAAAGAPMVYYGDEVGMAGENDPSCRAGMIWDMNQWDTSLLAHIRSLGRARASHETLRRGSQAVTAIDSDTVRVTRTWASTQTHITVRRGTGSPVATVLTEEDGS